MCHRIEEQCQMLTVFPKLGKRCEELCPGCRCLIVDPYRVIYRIHPEDIEIVRIVHGYRDIQSLFDEDDEE